MHLPLLVLTLLSLLHCSLSARTSATSFCKCICFTNSTIIALNPPSASPTPNASANPKLGRSSTNDDSILARDSNSHKLSCADCNRAFCLSQNLLICKNAKEDDVFASCFQRDSVKDETVVILFLVATSGLLGWALVKPWVERVREGRYLPIRSTTGDAARGDASRSMGSSRRNRPDSSHSEGSGVGLTTGEGSASGPG